MKTQTSSRLSPTFRMLDTFAVYARAFQLNQKDVAIILFALRAVLSFLSRSRPVAVPTAIPAAIPVAIPVALAIDEGAIGREIAIHSIQVTTISTSSVVVLVIDTEVIAPSGEFPHVSPRPAAVPTIAPAPTVVLSFSNAPQTTQTTQPANSATERLFIRTPSGKYLPATTAKLSDPDTRLYRKNGRHYRRVERLALSA